jgi:hypothetical protein
MERMVFFNIGWMKGYDGPEGVPIEGGGRFPEEKGYGYEMFNFREVEGYCYGYTSGVGGGGLNIDRLGARAEDESVSDILVVWVANDPAHAVGSVVVGWYRDATVYRSYQEGRGLNRTYKGECFGYRARAKRTGCRLLLPDERLFRIPRAREGKHGIGQANVWYADESHHARLRRDVWSYVTKGALPAPGKPKLDSSAGHSWQTDLKMRLAVERTAIRAAIRHYEACGYTVVSVEEERLGWDLEAKFSKKSLRIEVKGLSGDEVNVEMTPNEYVHVANREPDYRVCVVTNALRPIPTVRIFSYSPQSRRWTDDRGHDWLRVDEKIAARLSLG